MSWIRHRDLNLLTVGQVAYTHDARFSAVVAPASDNWSLSISAVQTRDEGVYECQIGTTPHVSHSIHLKVVGQLSSIFQWTNRFVLMR